MKKVYRLEQLEELKQKYTKEVVQSIEEIEIKINENYRVDRDVDKDLEGYFAVLESGEDIQSIKTKVLKGQLMDLSQYF